MEAVVPSSSQAATALVASGEVAAREEWHEAAPVRSGAALDLSFSRTRGLVSLAGEGWMGWTSFYDGLCRKHIFCVAYRAGTK
jgi:hypothetical protein